MAVTRRSPLAWAVLGSALALTLSSSGGWASSFASISARTLASPTRTAAITGIQGLGCSVFSGSSGCRGATAPAPRRGLPASAGPEVEAATLGLELGETVLGLAALYAIMSVNEYIYHRYFQHLGVNMLDSSRFLRKTFNLETYRGDGHVEHHRETLDDMTLDQRPVPMLDADPFRGTAFPWWATGVMTLSVLLPAFPVLSFLGWSAPVIVVTVVAALLVHAMVWNTLHPNMHGLPDVPVTHGVPSLLVDYRDSELFRWLRVNHEGHHRIEGAHGNYNVCCPLVDQLVGTYVGVIEPQQVGVVEPEKIPASA